MRKQVAGFDHHRYRQLLAEAVDEQKRLAFIDLLIQERAKRSAASRARFRSRRHAGRDHRHCARHITTLISDRKFRSERGRHTAFRLVEYPPQRPLNILSLQFPRLPDSGAITWDRGMP